MPEFNIARQDTVDSILTSMGIDIDDVTLHSKIDALYDLIEKKRTESEYIYTRADNNISSIYNPSSSIPVLPAVFEKNTVLSELENGEILNKIYLSATLRLNETDSDNGYHITFNIRLEIDDEVINRSISFYSSSTNTSTSFPSYLNMYITQIGVNINNGSYGTSYDIFKIKFKKLKIILEDITISSATSIERYENISYISFSSGLNYYSKKV